MGANLGAITNSVANQTQVNAGDGGLPFISDANGNLSPNPSYNPPAQQQLIMNGGQQDGGNPLYPMGSTIASDGGVSTKDPSYQAQNSDTAQAQSATQPQTNTGQFSNQFLNGLYQTQLGRAPDQAGYDFWNNALTNGENPQDIIKAFQTSPEYMQNQALKNLTPNPNSNPWGLN